jgi:hypothetical protein
LACTLCTILQQQLDGPRRLFLIDNSEYGIMRSLPVRKVLRALSQMGWEIEHRRSSAKTITDIKIEALGCGHSSHLVLIDNDVLFTRADTIKALRDALEQYDIAAVSPVAFDVDSDRVVLTPYIDAYDRYPANEHGLLEGTIALGTCVALARDDVKEVLRFWKWSLPYMEDQALIHFLKARRGYAYLRHHIVMHCGYDEQPSYNFDDDEVVRYLERLCVEDERYSALLGLRRELKDGADFAKGLVKR